MDQAFDDDFDLEVGDALLYVFDPGDGRAAEALQRLGVAVRPATTGSEIMAAAQAGELRGVIVAPFGDEELRELFMVAFRGRFPDVPVFFISERAGDAGFQVQAQLEGASTVLPWPLPNNIAATLHALLGSEYSAAPAEPSDAERKVLVRKLEAIDRPHTVDLVPKEELARAVEQHVEEATTLRSELTLVRERSQLLQRRIERLTQDLAAVTKQRDELKRKIKKVSGGYPRPAALMTSGADLERRAEVIKKIGANAENFIWGVEQTIRFLEELQFEAGDKRAPSLESHLRILRLTRKLLTQVQKSARDL